MTLFAVLSGVMLAQHLHVLCAEYPAVEVGSVPLLHRHVGGQVLVKPGLVPALLPGVVTQAVQLRHQQHQEHHGHRGHHHDGHYGPQMSVYCDDCCCAAPASRPRVLTPTEAISRGWAWPDGPCTGHWCPNEPSHGHRDQTQIDDETIDGFTSIG